MSAVIVRLSCAEDVHLASAASAVIDSLAAEHALARRPVEFLAEKIRVGHAAFALAGAEVVGFGYWCEWEGGRFISHSALVVRRDHWGHGLGRRLKEALFESSRLLHPDATLMSLTTSPQVKELNLSLGYRVVPHDQMTTDPGFWEACKTCHNYQEACAAGERCCCEGMILEAGGRGSG